MAVTVPDQCGSCGKPSTTNCSACKLVKYCDTSCQKKDWAVHKTMCDPELLAAEARPDPGHRRAILLTENGERPTFVWISMKEPGFDQFFGSGRLGMVAARSIVDAGYGDGKHLDHDISILHRDEMLVDGKSKKNTLLNKLTKGKMKEFWRGPVLVHGKAPPLKDCIELWTEDPNRDPCDYYRDLYPCDLGVAVKALARVANQQQSVVERFKQTWGEDKVNKD
ncbi:hypothetical protein LTS10_012314 [Elasticomyces elasticus]|nr:hypothetical protein LTS10_012314 [Elasticomyces elasticus]